MTAPAHAFTEPRTYFQSANSGGGGGRWFTGSPAEGYSCSVCHTGPAPETLTIEGVPEAGYVPGQSYDLRIAWPQFAARAAEIRAAGEEPASMGLVAELVAETGMGSGSLQISAPADADEGELCVLPAGEQAAELYRVRPGEETREEFVPRCDATRLGQRCIVAVPSCGAQELRFTWTAPGQWQGPIWLSLGFVATAEVSGDPTGDAVTELSRPILPAASPSEHHQTRLQGGCAVAEGPASAGGSRAPCTLALWAAGLWLWLRRRAGRASNGRDGRCQGVGCR